MCFVCHLSCFGQYVWNKLFSSDKLDGSLLLEMQDELLWISLSCHVFPLTIINLDFHQSCLSICIMWFQTSDCVRFELDVRALNLFLNLN